jgi:hypothetical protein
MHHADQIQPCRVPRRIRAHRIEHGVRFVKEAKTDGIADVAYQSRPIGRRPRWSTRIAAKDATNHGDATAPRRVPAVLAGFNVHNKSPAAPHVRHDPSSKRSRIKTVSKAAAKDLWRAELQILKPPDIRKTSRFANGASGRC